MADITVKFRDGSSRIFEDRGAPGGSYHNSMRCEQGWLIIVDPYGKETAIPADLVSDVEKAAYRRW